jgi:hypothetical protein
VIAAFTRRITESQVLIEDLLNNSVNVRLYRTLLELATQFGSRKRSDADRYSVDASALGRDDRQQSGYGHPQAPRTPRPRRHRKPPQFDLLLTLAASEAA